MVGIFKTVILLSGVGSLLVCLLLLLKPLMMKKMSAVWQKGLWFLVACAMVIPMWKLIPQQELREFFSLYSTSVQQETTISLQEKEPISQESILQENPSQEENRQEAESNTAVSEKFEEKNQGAEQRAEGLLFYASCIWMMGVCIYLGTIIISYWIFKRRKEKERVRIVENEMFFEVKWELRIGQNIDVYSTKDIDSPMLVGILHPVIYVPDKQLESAAVKMVYRHELMHLKHKDLLYKWFGIFVNAIHWFNPFAYIMFRQLSQACELHCDMAVTWMFDEEEQKLYMNTILDLVEQKGA